MFKRESMGREMIGVAAMILLVTVGALIYTCNFVAHAAHADGRVVQLIQRQDKDGTLYSTIFTFQDAGGASHIVKSGITGSAPLYKVGDAVGVLYLKSDPSDAEIDSFFSVWGVVFITGGLGLFGLIVSIFVLKWPRVWRLFVKQNAQPRS